MKTNILFFIIFFTEGIIFLILTFIFNNRDKNILKRANQITIGKVTNYTLLGNKGIYFPIVQYTVNDIIYNQRLKYSWIITKSSSFKNINPEIENNFLDTKLVISRNTHISRNVLQDKFPIGSELAVYYNPNNPKESYVLRFSKNPCIKIFLIIGILFTVLSFIGLVLLSNDLMSIK